SVPLPMGEPRPMPPTMPRPAPETPPAPPDDLRPVAVLDTLGLYCPVPIIRTSRKIREIPAGEVLEVLSDDPLITLDLRAWCDSNRHEYLGVLRQERRLRVFVRRLH